jgi:hypothetical protein
MSDRTDAGAGPKRGNAPTLFDALVCGSRAGDARAEPPERLRIAIWR